MKNSFFNISVLKNSRKAKLSAVVLIVILLEVFLFNFRFFQGIGYEPVVLEEATISSDVEYMGDGRLKFKNNSGKIYYSDIDTEIKNIYIDVENTEDIGDVENISDKSTKYNMLKKAEENKLIKIKLNINDESNSSGISMPERSIVSTVERTKYINLNLSGKSDELSMEFKNAQNKEIQINSVVLNKQVPFHFSLVRVLVILALIALVYIIRPGSEFYQYKLDWRSIRQRAVIGGIAALQAVIMISAAYINPMYVYNTVSWQSQYIELTDAIMEGHFYINEEPDTKLTELENPYDPSSRNEAGASAKWDHAYYEGKYYVYFGIVPALLFNIPAKLISGADLMPHICILILIPIFILMSYLLIYAIAKKFMQRKDESVPLLLYIMLTTLFVTGIGTGFLLVWPDMYTLPIFTAVTLGVSGLYFWLTAFKENDNGYGLSKVKLFAGSLLMALIAGCRPQLLLVLFTAAAIYGSAVFKERKLFSAKSAVESLCFALPIVLFALFMFYYNYSRFGSVFDFGAQYNMTTNDMTARSFDLGRIFQGIFYYVLQPFNIEGTFPYVTTTNFATNYMGITIKEGTYGGVLFIQPVLWILLIIPKIKRELKEKGLYALTAMLVAFAFIIAFADAIMAGILARYFIDFTWLLVLAAIIVIFTAYNKYRERDYIKIFNYCLPVCFMISLFITFAVTVGGRYYSPMDTNPEMFWKIASSVQFWL